VGGGGRGQKSKQTKKKVSQVRSGQKSGQDTIIVGLRGEICRTYSARTAGLDQVDSRVRTFA
jgi:hypothetical protein